MSENRTSEKPRVQIIVATHKKYRMPEDKMYLPLQVGAEGKPDLGYAKDNIGENISTHNFSFCELTGLYWAWKNLDAEYIGLVHYRRHFRGKGKERFGGILTYRQLLPMLGRYSIFVPRRRHYYIESLYSHYRHTHYAEHLDVTREIIAEKYPNDVESYDRIIRHTYGCMFNMAIMKREILNAYCSWLFDILFELDRRIDTTGLSAYQKRFPGRVSEILFNVWLDKQVRSGHLEKKEIKELAYRQMEKVNWIEKGAAFFRAKFRGLKYDGSF